MQLNQPSYHSFGVEAQNQPGSNPSWMNMKSKAIVVGIVLLGSFALLAAAFNGPAVGENSLDLKSSSSKDICKVKTYAGSVLQRAYESPMFALFEDTKSQTKFETSDIIRAGGNLYAICDSSWAISKLSMSLPNYSPENVQIGNPLQSLDGDTEDSGFEGIFAPPPVDASGNFLPAWDPSKDPLYVVRESIDTSGGTDSSDSGDSDSADREYHAVVEKVFLNATDPNVGYSVQESCPTVYQFEGDSKGLEGATMVRGVDGAEYILGLCEGNYCAEGDKGKDRGNGRVIVLKKTEGACSWDTVRLMEIPKSADFQDYSAISISWSGRIAITSQEESQLKRGSSARFAVREILERNEDRDLDIGTVQMAVRNFMNRHRQAINSVTGADKTAGGVAGWLGEHELSAESGVNDVVAAPGWKVDGDNVLAGLTTKAAIQNAHRAQRRNGGYMLMGIDNTYSLTVHGYPALVVCDIDENGKAHVIALYLMSGETTELLTAGLTSLSKAFELVIGEPWAGPSESMADTCAAIAASITAVFPNCKQAVCWFHCCQGLERNQGKFSSDEAFRAFKEQVRLLHSMTDTEAFTVGLRLLFTRWRSKEPEAVQWFETYWGTAGRCEWHAGATSHGRPATNNGTESQNGIFKRYATRRKRCNFGTVLGMLVEELKFQSLLSPTRRRQIILPTKKEWEMAQRWARQHEQHLTRQQDGAIYVPSHHTTTAAYLRADAQRRADLVARWVGRRCDTWQKKETVKSFVARHQTFYKVQLLPQEHPQLPYPSGVFNPYRVFKCTCPASFKCGRCKHALALAILDKHVQVPAQYVIDLPPTIRKRGRPANAPVQQPKRRRRTARR